jgi:hypothetical protein
MQRLMLAAGVLGPAATLSYALQRLLDAGGPGGAVLLSAHIPYFWRIAMAGLHGLSAAVLLSLLVVRPERWLKHLPGVTVLIVALSALAMCLCP